MDASDKQADLDRGIRYSDGGIAWGDVHYPDPAAIARCHAEWACRCERGWFELDDMWVPCRRCNQGGGRV